jgi:hypothetical protein
MTTTTTTTATTTVVTTDQDNPDAEDNNALFSGPTEVAGISRLRGARPTSTHNGQDRHPGHKDKDIRNAADAHQGIINLHNALHSCTVTFVITVRLSDIIKSSAMLG